MPTVLFCSTESLERELRATRLWRADVERFSVGSSDHALAMAVAARPDLVLIDRDLDGSLNLVVALREEPATRRSSIALLARGDLRPVEIEAMEAGANAILRLPPGPDWEARVSRLLAVPVRRDVRLSVEFAVEAMPGPGVATTPALVLNLSVNGLLIESHLPLGIGDDLGLVLGLPGPGAPVQAAGRVVRQGGKAHFGIELTEINGTGRERIRALVEQTRAA